MVRWFVDRSAQRGIPAVSLRRLLPEATFAGVSDLVVSGCSTDTRRLDPGQVFIALRGRRLDGHDFVGLALERGAAAVVVERPSAEAGRLQVIVPDARRAYARISQALAGDPSEALTVIGIAGTTGKTATALWLRAILQAHGRRVGLIGASGWSDGVVSYPARPVEPDSGELAEMLGRMVERRCETAVVAFSDAMLQRHDADALALSGALTTGVHAPDLVAPAAFTARQAQARLFRRVRPGGIAVVRNDDPDAELLGAVNLEARRVAYALEGPADVSAARACLDEAGTRFLITGFDKETPVRLRLIGRRNLASALAASAMAQALGIGAETVASGLESVAVLPGRMEPLNTPAPGSPAVGTWLAMPMSWPRLWPCSARRAPVGSSASSRPRARTTRPTSTPWATQPSLERMPWWRPSPTRFGATPTPSSTIFWPAFAALAASWSKPTSAVPLTWPSPWPVPVTPCSWPVPPPPGPSWPRPDVKPTDRQTPFDAPHDSFDPPWELIIQTWSPA